jgi:hypothetical protein
MMTSKRVKHSEEARENDVSITHHETRSLQLQHQWPRCREAWVLAQCPGLFELDLTGNQNGAEGSGSCRRAAAVPTVPSPVSFAPEKQSD